MKFDIFEKIFHMKESELDKICEQLKLDKNILKQFEEKYKSASIEDYSSLGKSHYRKSSTEVPSDENLSKLKEEIVDELIEQTKVWKYDGITSQYVEMPLLTSGTGLIKKEDINVYPLSVRPMLTGSLMKVDINQNSGYVLLKHLYDSMTSSDPKKSKTSYNAFRQGLDILDLDEISYLMLNQNKNAMGYWLPKMVDGVEKDGFFKIPKTTIIKVPITLLQLTRLGYEEINQTTFDIVNEYCHRVFELNNSNKYFVKTGTYSSKFDFRNALVQGESEVKTLGEYLLFIHSQALSMAHYDLSGMHKPIIYGVSTTNEWVVRDFIEDKEDNLTIYHGLPLHTEYRVFVDFDTKEVLGIHPYWEKEKMTDHFEKTIIGATNFLKMLENTDPKKVPNYEEEKMKAYQALMDAKHDLLTFTGNYEVLNQRYEENKEEICNHIKSIISNCNLTGQWSIDIMQNGNDFYLIDMQGAENSTYYKETVPEHLRKKDDECWIPVLDEEPIVRKLIK